VPEFVLHAQDIDETGKRYDFAVRGAWLAQVLAGTDVKVDANAPEGALQIQAHRQGADVVIHGRVSAGLVTECSRCLEDARIPVDTELGMLLTKRAEHLRPEPDELELTPEDLDREFFTGDTIVLDEIVREHLLLEVPLKPLCSEECAGIPVPPEVAGPADLAASEKIGGVDPRLAPLLKLVGKLDPTKE
jgi:uncharacterized protein